MRPKTHFEFISAADGLFARLPRTASASFALGFVDSNVQTAKRRSPIIRPFALRNKQFVSELVLGRAKEFLGTDKSYRKTVQHQGQSIVYDDRQQNSLARRGAGLAHSTVWRWLSWLGALTQTSQAAIRLISQKDPHSTLHREAIPVDPKKYRGEEGCARHVLLERAGRMVLTEAIFRARLKKTIFPTFATSCGWR